MKYQHTGSSVQIPIKKLHQKQLSVGRQGTEPEENTLLFGKLF
jgi:hypothetical protein